MILSAAAALQPVDRDVFLRLVAEALRGVTEIGDGLLHRTARAIMAEVLRMRPVAEDGARRSPSKYTNGSDWIRKPSKRRRPTRRSAEERRKPGA